MAVKPPHLDAEPDTPAAERQANAAPPRTEPGPSPPTTADLKPGLVRMKGLVDQLRARLDRRRQPRGTDV